MSTRSKSSQAYWDRPGQVGGLAQGTLRKVMGMGTTARFRFRLQHELPEKGFAQLVKRANKRRQRKCLAGCLICLPLVALVVVVVIVC